MIRENDGFGAGSALSDADRALMLAVAEREFAQGKIGEEEYEAILERCRVPFGAGFGNLWRWAADLIRRLTARDPAYPNSHMTPRQA